MANEKDLEGPARGNLNMQAVLSMRSSGYYSQRTAGAKHAIDSTLSLSNDALISLLTGDISRFADFGAADGGTSAALWAEIVATVRSQGDTRPIEVLYADLPSNDFRLYLILCKACWVTQQKLIIQTTKMFLSTVAAQDFIANLWLLKVCIWDFQQRRCTMFPKNHVRSKNMFTCSAQLN